MSYAIPVLAFISDTFMISIPEIPIVASIAEIPIFPPEDTSKPEFPIFPPLIFSILSVVSRILNEAPFASIEIRSSATIRLSLRFLVGD